MSSVRRNFLEDKLWGEKYYLIFLLCKKKGKWSNILSEQTCTNISITKYTKYDGDISCLSFIQLKSITGVVDPAKCGASQHHDSLLARKFSASEIIPEQKIKPRKLTRRCLLALMAKYYTDGFSFVYFPKDFLNSSLSIKTFISKSTIFSKLKSGCKSWSYLLRSFTVLN